MSDDATKGPSADDLPPSVPPPPLITLTSDFGLEDPFVGIMKGVVLSIAPRARLVDLTHQIQPQDVLGGALALEAAVGYFPADTVHLAVVDPGVGGRRRPIAVRTARGVLVGPDNGLFTLVLRQHPLQQAVELTASAWHLHPASPTFHGRDVFAPVAAHLAAGVPLERLGPAVRDPVALDLPQPRAAGAGLELTVLAADHFGNVALNLRRDELARTAPGAQSLRLEVRGQGPLPLSRAYVDVAPGQPLAYFNSAGRLEIGVRDGNAARVLDLKRGDRVRLLT